MSDTAGKLIRYLFAGGTAAIIDVECFRLLCYISTPIVLAAACSFCVAAVVNFFLTSHCVFRVTATKQLFVIFLIGAVAGLFLNVSVTSVGIIYLELPRTLAKTIAIGTTFLLNFWINSRVVFRNQAETLAALKSSS